MIKSKKYFSKQFSEVKPQVKPFIYQTNSFFYQLKLR